MTGLRAEQREIADKFCKWLGSEHLINFDRPAPWSRIKELFSEFAAENSLLSFDCEILKYRFPLRLVNSDVLCKDKEAARELWNDYWERRVRPADELIVYCRNKLCGIGSRQVKTRLNLLAKSNLEAEILRQLLELEDIQLTANKYYGEYRKRSIARGYRSIGQLLYISEQRPDVLYCGLTGFHGFRVELHPASPVGSVQFEWDVADFKLRNFKQRFSLPLIFYDKPQLYRLEELISRKLASNE